jgi:hypothetical protein
LDTAAGSLFCPCCRSSLLAATHRTTLRESVGSMRRNLPRGGSAAQQTAPRNFNLPIAQTAQQPAQTRLITGARSHRPSSVSSMFQNCSDLGTVSKYITNSNMQTCFARTNCGAQTLVSTDARVDG